MPTIAGLLKLS